MRILLIAPAFYDYHCRIVSQLEAQGHEVQFIAERPPRIIYSLAKKMPAALRAGVFRGYLKNVLARIEDQTFELVLVIRGEILEPWFLTRLRKMQPNCRFVMYQWDSAQVVNFNALLSFFDGVATFDPVDAERFGIRYLPLFFVPEYRIDTPGHDESVDLTFVGSFHDARYRKLKIIESYCEKQGIEFVFYIYISLFDYFKLKITKTPAPAWRDVGFRKLSQRDILNRYRASKGILDIENPKQSGLTMRTFEALATSRVLVTTNSLAVRLLPKLAARIVVVEGNEGVLSRERLSITLPSNDEMEAFSIHSWASQLLNL